MATPTHQERAESATRESRHLDFKSKFDAKHDGDWCEIIKDVIAMANSGGGVIVFGLDNKGVSSAFDPAEVLALDLAHITDKIFRYTGVQFADLEVIHIRRAAGWFAGFRVERSRTPIPFTNAGTYSPSGGGLPKTAFARGTVYFRHGAKSEPGNSQDFVAWRDREVARVRSEWMGGIRKVVSAPPGHTVTLIPSGKGASTTVKAIVHGEISASGKGQAIAVANAEEIWPYRQMAMLAEINGSIAPLKLTSHDIQCANRKFDVKNRPDLAYKPHRLASPQYSKDYLDLLINSARNDPGFFAKLREEHRAGLHQTSV